MLNSKLTKVLPIVAVLLATWGADANAGNVLRQYVRGLVGPTPSASNLGGFTPVAEPCLDPWGVSMSSGQDVTAYQTGAVNFGQACTSELRTCLNGELSGSYIFQECGVQAANDCNLQGYVVPHADAVFAYSVTSVPYPATTCDAVKETRTCTNGTLSGSFPNTTCTPVTGATCTFNGSTVAHGEAVPAFATSSVAYGVTCATQQRTCTNGTLSGTYGYATCEQMAVSSMVPGSRRYMDGWDSGYTSQFNGVGGWHTDSGTFSSACHDSGAYYWEVKINSGGGGGSSARMGLSQNIVGGIASTGYYSQGGTSSGVATGVYGSPASPPWTKVFPTALPLYKSGDVLGFFFDADIDAVYVYKNGVYQAYREGVSGCQYIALTAGSGINVTVRLQQSEMSYANLVPASGYYGAPVIFGY